MAENVWIGLVAALLVMLQVLGMYILQSIHKKIADICTSNTADHKDIQKRLYGHRHDQDTGDVVIPHEAA